MLRFANSPVARARVGAAIGWSCVLLVAFVGHGAETTAPVHDSRPLLTNAAQVIHLDPEVVRRSPHEARVRGVVTFPVEGVPRVWVQDASGGLLVTFTNTDFRPVAGQWVEANGSVGLGLLVPMLVDARVRVMGQAPLPEPLPATAARLAAGEQYGQWVSVEGVVRDVAWNSQRLILFIASGGVRFHAIVQPTADDYLPLDWLDARVDLHGVCSTDVDREGKPMGFTLYLPGTNHVHFLSRPDADIFGQPRREAAQPVLRQASDTRLKVAGAVTFHSPDGRIFLRDETGSLEARLLVPLARVNPKGRYVERPAIAMLRPGTRLELVGAPTATRFAPALRDAEFRVIGETQPPAPIEIEARQALSGQHDHALISLRARLLGRDQRSASLLTNETLVLQSGDTVFEATLVAQGTNSFPSFPKDALLQVAGICAVPVGDWNQGRSFRLLVREPGDVRYVGQPPFWANWPLRRIAGFALTLSLAASIWIYFLRRQVKQRTTALVAANEQLKQNATRLRESEEEIQRALVQERELSRLKSHFVTTVSHEFRTPLGVIMASAENLRDYHDRLTAQQRSEHLHDIFEATRTMSGLMEEVLLLGRVEAGKVAFRPASLNLPALCERFVDEVRSATDGRCPIHFTPAPADRPARGDEGLLRHILVNLLSNAVKYSPAGRPVDLVLEQREAFAIFTIRDQGIGIPESDAAQLFQAFHRGRNVGDTPGSGLGMVIVKRCVELHGGGIEFTSREGAGSTFIVRLPLFMKLA